MDERACESIGSLSIAEDIPEAKLTSSIAAPKGQAEDDMLQNWIEAFDMTPLEDPVETRRLVLAIMADWQQGRQLSDKQYLAAGMAMSVNEVRNEVLPTLGRSQAEEFLPFWQSVLARTPRSIRLVALVVTAVFAGIAGQVELMNICLHEASEIDAYHWWALTNLNPDQPPATCREEVAFCKT